MMGVLLLFGVGVGGMGQLVQHWDRQEQQDDYRQMQDRDDYLEDQAENQDRQEHDDYQQMQDHDDHLEDQAEDQGRDGQLCWGGGRRLELLGLEQVLEQVVLEQVVLAQLGQLVQMGRLRRLGKLTQLEQLMPGQMVLGTQLG